MWLTSARRKLAGLQNGQGRWSFPSLWHWWGHSWKTVSTSGLLSKGDVWAYWREFIKGPQGWLRDWSIRKIWQAGTPQPREQIAWGNLVSEVHTWWESEEKMEPFPVVSNVCIRDNENKLKCMQFPLNIRKKILLWGLPRTGTGWAGRLWSHHPWRKEVLTWSWATGTWWPFLDWEDRKYHLQQLLLSSTILQFFCERYF